MTFNFEKEMIYGKKHINELKYNNNNYDFRYYLKDCFNENNLQLLHNIGPKYDVFKKFGPDVQTWYHNKFYKYLKTTNKGKEMQLLYDELITNVILPYLNLNEALVQKFPSFRIQLPDNIAVAKKHTDSSLGHPYGEINFTYSFTDMYDSNTIFIEKSPQSEEYIKIEQKENTITSFNANQCYHYNELNKTGKTRMSMDFRLLPLNYYDKEKVLSSHSTNQKFVDGGYYKLINIEEVI